MKASTDQPVRLICVGLARKALEETLRRYPNTDPGALIFFSGASGLCEAPLTDEDFEWGRKVKAEWEAANGR